MPVATSPSAALPDEGIEPGAGELKASGDRLTLPPTLWIETPPSTRAAGDPPRAARDRSRSGADRRSAPSPGLATSKPGPTVRRLAAISSLLLRLPKIGLPNGVCDQGAAGSPVGRGAEPRASEASQPRSIAVEGKVAVHLGRRSPPRHRDASLHRPDGRRWCHPSTRPRRLRRRSRSFRRARGNARLLARNLEARHLDDRIEIVGLELEGAVEGRHLPGGEDERSGGAQADAAEVARDRGNEPVLGDAVRGDLDTGALRQRRRPRPRARPGGRAPPHRRTTRRASPPPCPSATRPGCR